MRLCVEPIEERFIKSFIISISIVGVCLIRNFFIPSPHGLPDIYVEERPLLGFAKMFEENACDKRVVLKVIVNIALPCLLEYAVIVGSVVT